MSILTIGAAGITTVLLAVWLKGVRARVCPLYGAGSTDTLYDLRYRTSGGDFRCHETSGRIYQN